MSNGTRLEDRVLTLVAAGPGRESVRVERILGEAGQPARACSTAEELVAEIDAGAAAVLVGEEVLAPPLVEVLSDLLERQPAWSSLPLIVLGEDRRSDTLLCLLKSAHWLTVLERPVEREVLRTAVQAAREARRRQYAMRDRLMQLEGEMLDASTHERQWFAQELHDGLCQQLSSLSFMTASLQDRLSEHDAAAGMHERMERLADLADRTVREARALARGLFPVELERDGLEATLGNLAKRTAQAFQITCELKVEEAVPLDDVLTVTNLYRITQEAVSNAVRHGRASHVIITVDVPGDLVLRVADDGVGIGGRPVPGGDGIGLRTMRRRAGLIGAALEVRQRDEGGTVVECRLPLDVTRRTASR